MLNISMLISFIVILSSILATAPLLLGAKSNNSQQKLSPFECGFSALSKARLPFSLRFFTMTLIFLLFDVEIALILPVSLSSEGVSSLFLPNSVALMMLIIGGGLLHEWNQAILKWSS